MLVQVEDGQYSWDTEKIAYIPTAAPWKLRQLEALTFTKKEREENFNYTMTAMMSAIVGGPMTGVPTIIAWATPGYVPATLMCGVGFALAIAGTVPATRRWYRTPRHKRALRLLENRRNAILLTRKGRYEDEFSTSSYAMQALLKTRVSSTLRELFKSGAAKNKHDVLAQLDTDNPGGNLLVKMKPDLDLYFTDTMFLDMELAKNRSKAKKRDIASTEAEIDDYAREVAAKLAEVIKLHEEEMKAAADTKQRTASDNLRMMTDSFRIARGKFLPED